MPREKITDSLSDAFELVVTWGRDSEYLQIATEASDWTERMGAFYDPATPSSGWSPTSTITWTATNTINTTSNVTSVGTGGPVQIIWPASPPGMQPAPKVGWYVNLNRHQVNELIRILRRARDQAFGRDE